MLHAYCTQTTNHFVIACQGRSPKMMIGDDDDEDDDGGEYENDGENHDYKDNRYVHHCNSDDHDGKNDNDENQYDRH